MAEGYHRLHVKRGLLLAVMAYRDGPEPGEPMPDLRPPTTDGGRPGQVSFTGRQSLLLASASVTRTTTASAGPALRAQGRRPSRGAAVAPTATPDAAAVVRQGLLAGLLSGLVVSVATNEVAVLRGEARIALVRFLAAPAFGPSVFESPTPLAPALAWGLALHQPYTAISGVLLAWLVAAVPATGRDARAAAGAILADTAVMLLGGFSVVAPALAWHRLPRRTEIRPRLVLRVGVWGGSQGAYFASGRVRRALAGGAAGHPQPLA